MNLALERLEARELRLLLAGALLIVATLLGSLLWPQIKQYRDARHSLAALLMAGTSHDDLARRQVALRNDVARMQQQFQGNLAGLTEEQAEARAVGLLQQLCWDHHLELVSVSPKPGDTVQNFREMAFDIETRGEYRDIYAWLEAMHNDLGSLVVKKFELLPVNPTDGNSPLSMKVEVVAYRSVEP